MGVCVHGLCLETVCELAKSADSNLGAVHVKHLARPTNNQTSLQETVFLLCKGERQKVRANYFQSSEL